VPNQRHIGLLSQPDMRFDFHFIHLIGLTLTIAFAGCGRGGRD
jgi:hypothetical protein